MKKDEKIKLISEIATNLLLNKYCFTTYAAVDRATEIVEQAELNLSDKKE